MAPRLLQRQGQAAACGGAGRRGQVSGRQTAGGKRAARRQHLAGCRRVARRPPPGAPAPGTVRGRRGRGRRTRREAARPRRSHRPRGPRRAPAVASAGGGGPPGCAAATAGAAGRGPKRARHRARLQRAPGATAGAGEARGVRRRGDQGGLSGAIARAGRRAVPPPAAPSRRITAPAAGPLQASPPTCAGSPAGAACWAGCRVGFSVVHTVTAAARPAAIQAAAGQAHSPPAPPPPAACCGSARGHLHRCQADQAQPTVSQSHLRVQPAGARLERRSAAAAVPRVRSLPQAPAAASRPHFSLPAQPPRHSPALSPATTTRSQPRTHKPPHASPLHGRRPPPPPLPRPPPVMASLPPGTRLGERYTVVREIQRGGTAVVYEGIESTTGASVALKARGRWAAVGGGGKQHAAPSQLQPTLPTRPLPHTTARR